MELSPYFFPAQVVAILVWGNVALSGVRVGRISMKSRYPLNREEPYIQFFGPQIVATLMGLAAHMIVVGAFGIRPYDLNAGLIDTASQYEIAIVSLQVLVGGAFLVGTFAYMATALTLFFLSRRGLRIQVASGDSNPLAGADEIGTVPSRP